MNYKFRVLIAIGDKDFTPYGYANYKDSATVRQLENEIFNLREVMFINIETGEVTIIWDKYMILI